MEWKREEDGLGAESGMLEEALGRMVTKTGDARGVEAHGHRLMRAEQSLRLGKRAPGESYRA